MLKWVGGRGIQICHISKEYCISFVLKWLTPSNLLFNLNNSFNLKLTDDRWTVDHLKESTCQVEREDTALLSLVEANATGASANSAKSASRTWTYLDDEVLDISSLYNRAVDLISSSAHSSNYFLDAISEELTARYIFNMKFERFNLKSY